jgi:hypothetical protein
VAQAGERLPCKHEAHSNPIPKKKEEEKEGRVSACLIFSAGSEQI